MDELDVICLGDFNADGSYYEEDKYLEVFPTSEYRWLVGNSLDTTVAVSDNSYDRIVTTLSVNEDYSGTVGVLRFDEAFDFSSLSISPKNISDHYSVWEEFFSEKILIEVQIFIWITSEQMVRK